ncbi:cytochrome P450 3A24-like [Biomphalaria glabrata]|uniref:Cytochrome P450 3A24-like n=1 Tax=Biomphalaria glabrata TaxID=6526 RepID=A0A9W3AT66_BIOGL|nr:cytochrome P450 3A24-like [Biomphalaria glabrata]XP_055890411.1 cytochrome P450 3A24-like [Biomphalaria glabrata]XP_055890412.1 cytochrome P450 3A24-like [Biomphalaria glabrata]XP_055890413.1 cytochrome P450 3A24-like [Biomphalaria glabrata]
MTMSSVIGVVEDFSNISLYLTLATVSVVLYWTYQQFAGTDNWTKYGVKHASMPMVQIKVGLQRLIQEHGDTVGFKRSKMTLVTRDLSILKEIMVKDFNNFTDRPISLNTRSLVKKGVFFLKGQDWRRVRHIITPSFSSGKLKTIFKTVEEKATVLTKVFEDFARKDELLPIKYVTGQYTSEIIARTAFGISSECLGKEDDEFTQYSKKLFKFQDSRFTLLLPFFQRFPWIQTLLVKFMGVHAFDGVARDADQYLDCVLRKSLAERLEAEQKGQRLPSDLLQSFINAKKAGDQAIIEDSKETQSSNDLNQSTELKTFNKTMTEDELVAQSILIIFAGFETTASTLQMCYYMLARHPDIQEKLFEEIESVVQSDVPTYEELSKLSYMEQVINETLRLYPPVSFISREAAETKTYGHVTIPKGASVFIPIFLILKDPKHFPDPENFDPERFNEENTTKRDPMAFIPFGYGPRLCIGMRLAYLEIKVALAISLRKVRFELNDRTEPKQGEEPTIRGLGILVPDKPFSLSVRLRH